jgi:hypothetical protein
MRSEKELRAEVRAARERARDLSGFWVSELAAAAAALEWAFGKQARPPSEDIGAADSVQGRIAAALVKAAEKGAAAKKPAGARKRKPAPPRRAR